MTSAGFLFLIGFGFYAYFLGGIDGLPPLPAVYLPSTSETPPPPPVGPNPIDQRLIQAFGDDCEELRREMKMEHSQKGLLLATDAATVETDGRVKLKPFSVAVFKDKGDGSYPEINTIRCEEAFLRFDQPIRDLSEIGNHKIIGAELRKSIKASNNRRTPLKSDDLEAWVPKGPVFFDEQQSRIWTDDFVKLMDMQSQPEPTTIKAMGLDLHLTKESGKDKPPGAAHANKGTAVSGVDRIVLHSDVHMVLQVDSRSGFLSSGPEKKESRPPAKPGEKPSCPEKSRVIILTMGPFTYDLPPDLAWFESPPRANQNPGQGIAPDQVQVWREHVQGTATLYDQIICNKLVLQFRKKQAADPKAIPDSTQGDREIESAHATCRPGEDVKLVMDTDVLEAHGNELIYHSAAPGKKAQTILRGTPMWALKDAHKITAPELQLFGADAKGEGQQGLARGPGQIDLVDHNSPTKDHVYHALWKDMLVVTKDREGERVFDLLTFTGEVSWLDDEHHQEMHGDKLQVWLEPPPREEEATNQQAKKGTAPDAPRQRPHKVEAFDHVTVSSPELNIRECEHLIVRFKDGPSPQLPETLPAAPAQSAEGQGSRQPEGSSADKQTGPSRTKEDQRASTQPAVTQTPTAPGSDKQAKEERRPINLTARRVAAYVLRIGSKNELQEVVSEGSVHVHQDGAKPEDKGIDIVGETLNVVRYPEGDILVVFGDARDQAKLQLGDLHLSGPKVTINQKTNMAEVDGVGAMRMPSNTGLDGAPAKKPASELEIHWTKDMLFNGKDADFRGGVVAYQDDGCLRCQAMQVTLDRTVSFKEGQKSGQAAKVDHLVCDRKVYVAETIHDPKGELIRYERLVAQQLTVENQQGPTRAPGPGSVYLLQLGTPEGDPTAAPGAAKSKPATTPKQPGQPKPQMTLTRVDFQGWLFSDTNAKDKTRLTKFNTNVEVFHVPADNPDIKIIVDQLPKGGLYLKCEQLTILSKPMPDGKTGQYMRAEKSVSFRTPEFYGNAPVVKYDQPNDQMIFEGQSGNLVNLYRFRPPNEPEHITGQTILYNRRTGVFQVDKGRVIQGSTR
jgi:hypothetical protein